ncbi:hypothetical protein HQ489_06145 [Candidatus Woesearchaeota archaeon]|nr:hypothetical protein [Candidatus Woesearchaeota archaeon]
MAKKGLNELSLAKAGAVVSAASMLLLGIGWNLGVYVGAAQAMAKWHLFFSKSLIGIVGGMVEGAVWSFVILYVFGLLYNKWS